MGSPGGGDMKRIFRPGLRPGLEPGFLLPSSPVVTGIRDELRTEATRIVLAAKVIEVLMNQRPGASKGVEPWLTKGKREKRGYPEPGGAGPL